MTKTRITHIIMSYRPIGEYTAGKHGKILVMPGVVDQKFVQSDSRHGKEATLYSMALKRFKEFERELDTKGIVKPSLEQVIMYTGLHLQQEVFEFAREAKEVAKDLLIVGCLCDFDYKATVAKEIGAKIIPSECSGIRTMGKIADFLTSKTSYDPRID